MVSPLNRGESRGRKVCFALHQDTHIAVLRPDLHHDLRGAAVVLAATPLLGGFPLEQRHPGRPELRLGAGFTDISHQLGLRDRFGLFEGVYECGCGFITVFGALQPVVEGLFGDSGQSAGGLAVVAFRNRGEELLDGIRVANGAGRTNMRGLRQIRIRDLFRGDSERQRLTGSVDRTVSFGVLVFVRQVRTHKHQRG